MAGPASIFRRIGAVIAGVLVIVVLSIATDFAMHAAGVFPRNPRGMTDALYMIATAYRIVYSVLGCYVAAWLAPDRPMGHALTVGIVGVIAGLAGVVVVLTGRMGAATQGHAWYPIVIFLIPIPCAWLGGKLRVMQSAKQKP